MEQSFKHTFTVSLDISIEGYDLSAHQFEIECYSWNNGERDPSYYEETQSIKFLSEQPEWMNDMLRNMLEQKAWNRFTFHIEQYKED